MKKTFVFTICALVLLVIVVGCEKEKTATPSASSSAAPRSTEPLPVNLIATTQPAGAVDVVAVKKSVKDGDRVVIKGRIGGAKEPLMSTRAILTIADLGLRTCDKSPMDKCETPWDSCCQPSEEIVAKTAS